MTGAGEQYITQVVEQFLPDICALFQCIGELHISQDKGGSELSLLLHYVATLHYITLCYIVLQYYNITHITTPLSIYLDSQPCSGILSARIPA